MIKSCLIALLVLVSATVPAQNKMLDTTVVNNGQAYRIKQMQTSPNWSGVVVLLNGKPVQDTIYADLELTLTVRDFDGNGYLDLILSYPSRGWGDYTADNVMQE